MDLARSIHYEDFQVTVATSFYEISYNDNTLKSNGEPEHASTQLAITTLNAGNLAAQTTLIAALRTAISGVLLGDFRQDTITLLRPIPSVSRPSSTLAQRENKWLLRAHGATSGQKFRYSLPTADLSLLPDGSEFLDLSASPGDDLKSAFDAVVRNPNDASELLVLDSAQFVGRTG